MAQQRFFGWMLRAKRGKRRLSDVAGEAGISSATLNRIERGGDASLSTFIVLCQWLGVDPGIVMGFGQEERDSDG